MCTEYDILSSRFQASKKISKSPWRMCLDLYCPVRNKSINFVKTRRTFNHDLYLLEDRSDLLTQLTILCLDPRQQALPFGVQLIAWFFTDFSIPRVVDTAGCCIISIPATTSCIGPRRCLWKILDIHALPRRKYQRPISTHIFPLVMKLNGP